MTAVPRGLLTARRSTRPTPLPPASIGCPVRRIIDCDEALDHARRETHAIGLGCPRPVTISVTALDADRRNDGLTSDECEELRRLRRENRDLREDREIRNKCDSSREVVWVICGRPVRRSGQGRLSSL